MWGRIILVVVIVWFGAVVVGSNRARDKIPLGDVVKKYDRRNPNNPMRGIYTDSNCSVEEQTKGIYNCPTSSGSR